MATNGSILTERRSSASEYLKFLQAWIRKPRQTASIVPSSHYLGRLMAAQIDPEGGRVMEFGGGTGALTREILATGLPVADLEVVEINEALAHNLRGSFPGVAILQAPAQSVLAQAAGGAGGYQCIISGLPLLAMSKMLQKAILGEAFRLLRPGGAVIQFTYSPRPPVPERLTSLLGLRAERIGTIVRNVPPATVFRYRRVADIAQD